MGWIILSSISGAIVAYAVTKVMCIKFLSELETVEKKHREELLFDMQRTSGCNERRTKMQITSIVISLIAIAISVGVLVYIHRI